MRKAATLLGSQPNELPETFWYSAKRRLLGPPMVNEQLQEERLSKPLALGVLSCDGISSANYGSELILYELLPFFGLASFTLLLPLTGVVLLGIFLVVLSYREVVSVYTRAGGSYVVARENFGPRVAQVAAVALMVDYVVTVAVQNSAGSAAILSTFPALARPLGDVATLLLITVAATLVMAYVNLRGVRENGRTFALPTYLFSGSVGLMIIVGLAREFFGGGLTQVTWHSGTVPIQHTATSLIAFAAILRLARAFANGGSSLTGIEAVSNAVSALRPPEGRNARRILEIQGAIVMFLIAGISWLAHITHAVPYASGVPTVVSQEAGLVFGHSAAGQILFYLVQAGAITILFTGGNTSFSGFPFLTSFVAEDSFLPRWLSKRGHRLVFSNGIIVLTVLALALLFAVGANTAKLVPFYAIGVFTGFSMAGFGMVRYHLRQREQGWRRRLVINLTGGIYTALVVVIFAVVKFTEGAWLVVVVFPIGVFAFIRLNRAYRAESRVLQNIGERRASGVPPRTVNYTRRVVLVFVDDFDLATLAALRYAKSLRATTVRAVHFVIDGDRAERLRAAWLPDRGVSLDFVDCPDRRLTRCAADLVAHEAEPPGTQVTAILPRRSYSALLGRLLHDRTADKIAGVVSRVPDAAATIIPFDVQNRLHVLQQRQTAGAGAGPASLTPVPGPRADGPSADGELRHLKAAAAAAATAGKRPGPDDSCPPLPGAGGYDRPVPPKDATPIGAIREPGKFTVEGRVRVVEIRSVQSNSVLACELSDSTGDLTALFYGRSKIAGMMCGSRVRLRGQVGIKEGAPVMVNPAYELMAGKGD
jgi:amino acid transporter